MPWTQHLYAYTGNNPVNMVDPTGHYTNTASDQYANYRYDFEKKTLVPYQDAQNQYNGYERTNMIPKRRTPQPSRSSSWQNDASNQYVEPGSGRIYSSGGYTYAPETGWIDQLLNANAANNGHSSGSSTMYAAGGVAGAIDGPMPYADAVAGILLIGAANLLRTIPANPGRSQAIPRAIPRERDSYAQPPEDTIIYRWGDTSPSSFVPRAIDVTGLSYSLVPPPPGRKATFTTIKALNATGTVVAIRDGYTHVSVVPAPGAGTMSDWIELGKKHPATWACKSVAIKWKG